MALRIIEVSPAADGWGVSATGMEPLIFLAGAHAEQHARRLAAGVAGAGWNVRLVVRDRTGAVIGRLDWRGNGDLAMTG